MSEVKLFESEEFGVVRTILIDGRPWFVGNDVARSLEYARPYEAVTYHCKGAMVHRIPTNGGGQEAKIIPEGDMYRLIVKAASQSNSERIREKAERFESWVFDEVLPSIRQTGTYSVPKSKDSYMIEDPVERAKRWIEEQEEKKALEIKIEEMKPKAELCDKLLDAGLLVNFRDAAKEIGISQSQLIGWLKEKGYVYSNSSGELRPMEKYMESGLFEVKPYQNPYNGHKGSRTMITGRGLAAFKVLIDDSGHNRDTMKKHGGRKKK